MKKTTYILGIISLFAMLFQSCTKENNSISATSEYYYLTVSQLNQTPYFTNSKFDTISFSSNQGDTITFVKTKTDISWYGERANSNPDDHSMNYYQIISNTYNTIKGSGSLEIHHAKKENSYQYVNVIEVNFSDLIFNIYDDRIGLKSSPFYLDSISFNSKTYYNVLYVYHDFTFSDIGKLYINKNYGIFQIEDKRTNIFWSLIK